MLININLCGLRPISIVTSKQCKIESASSKWYCDVYCYAIESSECASNRTTGKIILREKPHHIQITSKRTEVEKICKTRKKTQNRMRDREQWRKQQQIKRHPKDTYNDVVDDTKSEWKQNCIFENYLRDASCVKWKCMHNAHAHKHTFSTNYSGGSDDSGGDGGNTAKYQPDHSFFCFPSFFLLLFSNEYTISFATGFSRMPFKIVGSVDIFIIYTLTDILMCGV